MRNDDASDYGTTPVSGDGPLFESPAAGGPFADSQLRPTPAEIAVASLIWAHRGRTDPISISQIISILGPGSGWSVREVKDIVFQLRVAHRMKIGAKRTEPFGYFRIVDLEDLETATHTYKAQILEMLRVLRVLETPERMREFEGQLRLGEGGQ